MTGKALVDRRSRVHRLAPLRAPARRGRRGVGAGRPLDRLAENVAHLRDRPGFHLVVDSVLHSTAVNELVYSCDVVYHLAAAVGVRLIVEQPVRTLVTNLRGTELVLEHAHTFGKRVLVASTSEVYGDHREERPLARTTGAIYGPTTQRRLGVRRLEGDGRVPRARLPPGARPRLRHRAPVQHRRPAAERPSTGWSCPASCERRSRASRSRSTATARRRGASATSGHDPRARTG